MERDVGWRIETVPASETWLCDGCVRGIQSGETCVCGIGDSILDSERSRTLCGDCIEEIFMGWPVRR